MAPANQGLMSDSHHDPRMEGRGSSWKATKMSSPERREGGRGRGRPKQGRMEKVGIFGVSRREEWDMCKAGRGVLVHRFLDTRNREQNEAKPRETRTGAGGHFKTDRLVGRQVAFGW